MRSSINLIKIPKTPIFTLFADFIDSSCVRRYVEKRGSLPANNLKRSTVRVARTKVEETKEEAVGVSGSRAT